MRNLRSAGKQESTRLRGVVGTHRDWGHPGCRGGACDFCCHPPWGLCRDRLPGDTDDRSGGKVADLSPQHPRCCSALQREKVFPVSRVFETVGTGGPREGFSVEAVFAGVGQSLQP